MTCSTKCCTIISSGFGIGFIKYAPGTLGSLLGLFIYELFHIQWVSFCVILSIACIAVYNTMHNLASSQDTRQLDNKTGDPQWIVVDEMIGLWIALLGMPESSLAWQTLLCAFLLFRFFDIIKPWPIGYIDKKLKTFLHNPCILTFGIFLDDMIAGILTAATVRIMVQLRRVFL